MTRPAVLAAVGVAVAAVAALTACSTGDRVDLGDDSSGNLVAAIAGEPDQLDPQKTSAYFSFEVLENVFDTLVEPDPNLEMRPALAESWTVSPDQLSWTFHLRRGVTFHDGSPFTADDVVYSYRRIIDQELANADKLSAVTGITAADPSTVVITLKQPTPNLLTNLGGFKGLAIVQRRNVESGEIAGHPVGTGPFAFQSQKSGDSIILKANPAYWAGAPKVSGVTFRFISEPSTALSALQAGEIDWTDSIPTQRVAQLKDDDSIILATTASNDYGTSRSTRHAHRGTTSAFAKRSLTRSTGMRSCRRQATAPRWPISLRSPRATRGTPRTTPTAITSTRRKACWPTPEQHPRASTCWSPTNTRKQ
jgi:peptide/nickel transport system substrate-binding protein